MTAILKRLSVPPARGGLPLNPEEEEEEEEDDVTVPGLGTHLYPTT